MSKGRDNFSPQVKELLAKRVGTRCSLPECRAHTSGPGDPGEASNVGVAAHIHGASPKGPRYDVNQTSAERRDYKNGIWTCWTCSKRIDDATSTYTVDVLKRAKELAEQSAKEDLGRPLPLSSDGDHLATKVANKVVAQLQTANALVQDRRRSALENFDQQIRHALSVHIELLEGGNTTPELLIADSEFQRIIDNYGVEAQREALFERVRMLAYALVGTLCNENLTISQKSRTERTIRELDPLDVTLLYQLSNTQIKTSPNDSLDRSAMKRMSLLDEAPASRDALRASGCVEWKSNGGMNGGVLYAYVTTIGGNVLEVLRGYTNATSMTTS